MHPLTRRGTGVRFPPPPPLFLGRNRLPVLVLTASPVWPQSLRCTPVAEASLLFIISWTASATVWNEARSCFGGFRVAPPSIVAWRSELKPYSRPAFKQPFEPVSSLSSWPPPIRRLKEGLLSRQARNLPPVSWSRNLLCVPVMSQRQETRSSGSTGGKTLLRLLLPRTVRCFSGRARGASRQMWPRTGSTSPGQCSRRRSA